jgi:hypothetical protein
MEEDSRAGWADSGGMETLTSPCFRLDARLDRAFIDMLRGYRCHGGLARESELPCRARGPAQDTGSIRFEWSGVCWLPLFQFEPCSLALRESPRRVMAELAPAFDGWGMASWFAEPSHWLGGARPVERLDADLPAVLEAARADRFIAAG